MANIFDGSQVSELRRAINRFGLRQGTTADFVITNVRVNGGYVFFCDIGDYLTDVKIISEGGGRQFNRFDNFVGEFDLPDGYHDVRLWISSIEPHWGDPRYRYHRIELVEVLIAEPA